MSYSNNNENKETFGTNMYNFGKGILRTGLSPYVIFSSSSYRKNDREKILSKTSEEIYNMGNIIGLGTFLPQAAFFIENPKYLAIPIVINLIDAYKNKDSIKKNLAKFSQSLNNTLKNKKKEKDTLERKL